MSKCLSLDPGSIAVSELHSHLLGAVTPRPIGFVSTIDEDGQVNLSPFSFFNCFGSNPPVLIFSPSLRVRDKSSKHTLENARSTGEVVIGIANYSIAQQLSLSSTEYDRGVNEFVKSGLTEEPSLKVKPPRVKECPVSFECRVNQIIATGTEGGAGNLVICEILMMHIHENILGDNGKIDPNKLDVIGRLGENFYCRITGDSIFEIEKPLREKGVGVDLIPPEIRNLAFLDGNALGSLGNIASIPTEEEVRTWEGYPELYSILKNQGNQARMELLSSRVAQYLQENKIREAWKVLLTWKIL